MADILLMAVTRMLSGVCIAGFGTDRHPVTGLCWVRPVRSHDTVLLGDITDPAGRVLQCGDVVTMDLLRPRPLPPHVEDWLVDWVYRPPRLARRLIGERWARFLAEHRDPCPQEVLGECPSRSLCLVEPEEVWARWLCERGTRRFEARLGLHLPGAWEGLEPPGLPVTDLRWRALGRSWLGQREALDLAHQELLVRLGAQRIYLVLGLARARDSRHQPLVVAVHTVPEYACEVDYGNL